MATGAMAPPPKAKSRRSSAKGDQTQRPAANRDAANCSTAESHNSNRQAAQRNNAFGDPANSDNTFRNSPLAGFRVYTCGDMEKRQSPHRAFGFVFKANGPTGHAHHHLVSSSRLAGGRLRI